MGRSNSGPVLSGPRPAAVDASITDRSGEQRLSLTCDETKQAFALRDERTGLSISEITIQLTVGAGEEQAGPAEIGAAEACVEPTGSGLRFSFCAAEGTRYDAIWVLSGVPGQAALTVKGLPEDATLHISARIGLGEGTFPCRLSPEVGTDQVIHMSDGVVTNRQLNAVYSPERDVGVEFQAPSVLFIPNEDGNDFLLEMEASGNAQEPQMVIVLQECVFQRHSPYYRPSATRGFARPICGWLSYYCLFEDPDEQQVLAIADFAAEHLVPFGMEYFSVEMWQANHLQTPVQPNYWSVDYRKFPHGMKWLMDEIRKRGLKPGLWAVLFGTGDEVFHAMWRELFLHDEAGNPWQNWSGYYLLDPTRTEVKQMMSRYVRLMTDEWGAEYLKLDGLSLRSGSSYSEGFFQVPEVQQSFAVPAQDPFRDCLLGLREAMGPDCYFLACGGDWQGACVGVADGARISSDVFYYGETPDWSSVVHSVREAVRNVFFHNILWHNDPDIVAVRPPLPLSEAAAWTTALALLGQVMFDSDILPDLDKERVGLLQQVMPVVNARPSQLYALELQPIIDLKVARPFGQWDVVGVFNWEEEGIEEETFVVELSALGLDSQQDYLIYNYAERSVQVVSNGSFSVTLPPHGYAVFSVHKLQQVPQVISTNRHVAQGAICLEQVTWHPRLVELTGKSRVVGRHPYVLSVWVPEGYEIKGAQAKQAQVSYQEVGPLLEVTLEAGQNVSARWRLQFART